MSLLFSPFFSYPTKSAEKTTTLDNFLLSSLLNYDDSSKLTLNNKIWNPSSDISVSNESVTIISELPGLKKDDIDIQINDNVLTISGEKKDYNLLEQPSSSSTATESLDKPTLEAEEEEEEKSETSNKSETPASKSTGFKRSEIFYGSFKRSYKLPKDIDLESVVAKHEDGVLTIEILRKKPEQPKPTKIQIN